MVDVRTPYPEIWENNPHLTPLNDHEAGVRTIDCHYPLINRSNNAPFHIIQGFSHFLAERLTKPVIPTEFKGDIHLSQLEKSWYSQVREITGDDLPFWIVVAGGKSDVTIK